MPEPDFHDFWKPLFDAYEPYHFDILMIDLAEAADLLAALAEAAPDDDHLRAFSIALVEAFLSREGSLPELERAMRTSSKLRTAWCHAWSAVPDEWQIRLDSLVQPGERPQHDADE